MKVCYNPLSAFALFAVEDGIDLTVALNAGTTTNLDHAHHTWSNETSEAGLNATLESGARVVWGYTFHNVSNFTMPEQIANFRDLMASFPSDNKLITPAMAYDHWPWRASTTSLP
jgi:cytosine/adenosine deaminase-related metal-dependent hydrolase